MIIPNASEFTPTPPDSDVLVVPINFNAEFTEITSRLEMPIEKLSTREKASIVWCVAASCLIAPLFLSGSKLRARRYLGKE